MPEPVSPQATTGFLQTAFKTVTNALYSTGSTPVRSVRASVQPRQLFPDSSGAAAFLRGYAVRVSAAGAGFSAAVGPAGAAGPSSARKTSAGLGRPSTQATARTLAQATVIEVAIPVVVIQAVVTLVVTTLTTVVPPVQTTPTTSLILTVATCLAIGFRDGLASGVHCMCSHTSTSTRTTCAPTP